MVKFCTGTQHYGYWNFKTKRDAWGHSTWLGTRTGAFWLYLFIYLFFFFLGYDLFMFGQDGLVYVRVRFENINDWNCEVKVKICICRTKVIKK